MMCEELKRWRLVLGRFSEEGIPGEMGRQGERMSNALDYLYGREYSERGVRMPSMTGGSGPGSAGPNMIPSTLHSRIGGTGESIITIPHWIREVRKLFPRETVQTIEKHALDRYELTQLLTDKEVLETLEPNMDLLKTLLTFRNHLNPSIMDTVRNIIARVVRDITDSIREEINRALVGRVNRFGHSPVHIAANLDWKDTVRRNLKHYNTDLEKLIIRDVRFYSRVERRLPWDIILCIDQSGSMAESVIYSAVMAGILSNLPFVNVKLVIFDTSIVDLSDHVGDPVEVLMNVQLGGGTNIAQAVEYCEQLVKTPSRTIFTLLSDFYEGGALTHLYSAITRMKGSGMVLLGLASMDEQSRAVYDTNIAEKLASLGMEVAALTPGRFAEWLSKQIS